MHRQVHRSEVVVDDFHPHVVLIVRKLSEATHVCRVDDGGREPREEDILRMQTGPLVKLFFLIS